MGALFKQDARFVLNCHFDDRDVPKDAGFKFDAALRAWTTTDLHVAMRLVKHASDDLKAEMTAAVEADLSGQGDLPLLKPPGKLASRIAATLTTDGNAMRIGYADRDEDFREIVKNHGFRWDRASWFRLADVYTGTAADRIADVARELLGAGYMCRVMDAEAHAKVLSGDIEEEHWRWVKVNQSGDYKGWFRLEWEWGADIYTAAKSIPGSRYADKVVHVPASAADEVTDFATQYGFLMDDRATAAVEAHRALLSQGVVVNLGRRPKRKMTAAGAMAPGEIHDDLRDDD